MRLLRDLRNIFDGKKAEQFATGALLEELWAAEDAPWGSLRGEPLDARGLARLLKPYGIRPEKLRQREDTFRGYRRANFEDAWARYTPDTPEKAEHAEHKEHPANRKESDVPHNREVPEYAPHTEHENPHEQGDVPRVPHIPGYPGTAEGDEIRSSESPPVANERDGGLTAEEVQMIEELVRSEVLADQGEGGA